MKRTEFYLRNISRRWQIEVKKLTNTDKLIILSPYLTPKTAESILSNSNISECEIYTVFSFHNFVSGASSLKTLKKLYQQGCKLYHLPRLHAKMVIAPGKFATIGSQNLTKNGVNNKESSMITYDQKEINQIQKALDNWLIQRQEINLSMIENIEKKITILRRKLSLINREIRKEINDLEDEFWKNQAELIEQERLAREAEELRRAEEEAEKLRQAQLQEQARKAEELRRAREEAKKLIQSQLQEKLMKQKEEHWKGMINSARHRVQQLSSHGEIDKELAKEFIRESAYWDHPTASRMVHAPRHDKRIYGSPNNWRIDFGANSFLVGHAIWRCQQTILDFIEKAESGSVIPQAELRESLENKVRGAVANHEGDEYEGYYSATDGDFLIFGTQAIKISSFVNLILRKAKLEEIFKAGKS
jgi:hypothetical protein